MIVDLPFSRVGFGKLDVSIIHLGTIGVSRRFGIDLAGTQSPFHYLPAEALESHW
jgi:hypothetical protein